MHARLTTPLPGVTPRGTRDPVTRAASLGQYARLEDIRMYYEIHGNGPRTVLMLNGGYQTAEDYRFMLERFPPDEYIFILIDHRGRGRTDDGDGPISYPRIAHDVVLLLDHLRIKRLNLVGHSEGGCVAMELLLHYSDRVETATLVGTPLRASGSDRRSYKEQTIQMKKKNADGMSPSAGRMIDTYERLAADRSRWPLMIDKLYKGWGAQPTYTKAMLNTISTPVLVIRTEHDQIVPAKDFDRTARFIPKARIYSIPDGAHNVLMKYPDEIDGAIKEFIGEHAT